MKIKSTANCGIFDSAGSFHELTKLVLAYCLHENFTGINYLSGGFYELSKGNDHIGHKNSVADKQELGYVSSDVWYQAVPKDLPFYLISGSMDPVGNYGKGILEVKQRLEAQHLSDFSFKLYEEHRHEILNEIGRENVYADILAFVEQHIS